MASKESLAALPSRPDAGSAESTSTMEKTLPSKITAKPVQTMPRVGHRRPQ